MHVVLLLMVKKVLQDFLIFLLMVVEPNELLVLLIFCLDQVLFFGSWLISLGLYDLLEHDAFQVEAADSVAECALHFFLHSLKQ